MAEVKDSGSMREFATGAHRDNAEGKGRCDLLPLKQIAYVTGDPVILELANFVEDFDKVHIANALNIAKDTVKEYDGCYSTMFLEVAKLYEDGANKYGENNWKNGMPLYCFIDSGTRHYYKTIRGDDDEPHHRGFVWNMLGALWTIDNIPNALEEFKQLQIAYKIR